MRSLLIACSLFCTFAVAAGQPGKITAEMQAAVDAYCDGRFLAGKQADDKTAELIKMIEGANLSMADVEGLLRSGHAKYANVETKGKLALREKLECDQVDYTTAFFLYVPKSYDPAKAAPILLVGHGGNGAMDRAYAQRAAQGGLVPWLNVVEKEGMILAAPLSERGWGPIGYSVLLTLLSKTQRELHIDPDRVYLTGHSMGGHLTWRCGIYLPDRWAAIGPMSGGYDYVDDKQVFNLINVPGYATYGTTEPYNINKFDNKIKEWMEQHDYDWKMVEKKGGHQIFGDELPKIAEFMKEHPRNLYRPRVYARLGGSLEFSEAEKNPKWNREHAWKADHPISIGMIHWLRLIPLPKDTPADKSVQTIQADNLGGNRFVIASTNVRKVRIYLHPKMIDFSKPVVVEANGKVVFNGNAAPSLKTMLNLVREYDDRGLIFFSAVDIEIATDKEVPDPRPLGRS
jgi:hypothetical protein